MPGITGSHAHHPAWALPASLSAVRQSSMSRAWWTPAGLDQDWRLDLFALSRFLRWPYAGETVKLFLESVAWSADLTNGCLEPSRPRAGEGGEWTVLTLDL